MARTTRMPVGGDDEPIDAPEASVGALVEQAFEGAKELATREASLVLVELEEEARALRRAAVLAIVAGACGSAALAWGGVAAMLATSLGAAGIAVLAAVAACVGAAVLLIARRSVPESILARSRARLEQRFARVTESLR